MRNPIYHVKHLAIAILMGLNITATAQQINHPSLLFTADRIMSAKQRIESEPPFAQAWEQIKRVPKPSSVATIYTAWRGLLLSIL